MSKPVIEREVLFEALVGSHNYNLATEDSDKDFKVFTCPTFEDLYFGKEYSKSVIKEDGNDYDVHDIRKLPSLFFKSNINFLEVLFSDEVNIVSNEKEINRIFEMRNEIAKINLPYLFNACRGMHIQKMKSLEKGTSGTQHLVDSFGYDTKQALHAYRVLNVAVKFAENGFSDFKSAISYDEVEAWFMKDIKKGWMMKDVFEKFVNHYYESTFVHVEELYKNHKPNTELKEEIDELIKDLVKGKLL